MTPPSSSGLSQHARPIIFLILVLALVGLYLAFTIPIAVFPTTNFPRIVIAIGPPRYVPRVVDTAHIERLQGEMEAELLRLYRLARDALKS